jgi:hypothetical protein
MGGRLARQRKRTCKPTPCVVAHSPADAAHTRVLPVVSASPSSASSVGRLAGPGPGPVPGTWPIIQPPAPDLSCERKAKITMVARSAYDATPSLLPPSSDFLLFFPASPPSSSLSSSLSSTSSASPSQLSFRSTDVSCAVLPIVVSLN